MSIELKPCPFCGGEAESVINEYLRGFTYIECHECGARGSTSKERQAIKAWNTRAERTCRMNRYNSAVWACSECGRGYMESLLPEVGEYCMGCGAKVVDE